MTKIHKLSQLVIQTIAAGQVVERPSSVIKELIENSLDANCKNITIELESGGQKSITIRDDGDAMTKQNLFVSWLPHTTNKIKTTTDLGTLSTFGFRGEALSSISSVSKVIIQSRPINQKGHEIVILNGKKINDTPIGIPIGTNVLVTSLFGNIPARKKHLKSHRTEYRHTLESIYSYALSHPNISFEVLQNGQQTLSLKKQSLEDRITTLLGKKTCSLLFKVKKSNKDMSLNGFIGAPQLARQRSEQYLFVNNRPVKSNLITRTVKQMYSGLIDPRNRPFFLVNLLIHPSLIDINIDPKKENISFVQEKSVVDLIKKSILKTLRKNNLAYQFSASTGLKSSPGTAKLLKKFKGGWDVRTERLKNNAKVMTVGETYIVFQTKNGAIIMDPHAAHERILYNHYLNNFNRSIAKSITLSKPLIIDLQTIEYQMFLKHRVGLEDAGFKVNVFGTKIIKIEAIPAIFVDRDIHLLVKELFDILDQNSLNDVDIKSLETIAYLACRGAIKSGDKLTTTEAIKLLNKLFSTENNYTCPHGRPTRIEIKKHELDRMFKRK